MEYELFRSKLKPSIDGALIPSIIRRSSSGLNSYRTTVMELMIEGSIQERRERMLEKAKKSLLPDPTPQAKRTSEAPNMSIPEVTSTAPAPAPQLQSQSLPNDATGIVTSPASASAEYNTPPDPSALSRPARKKKRPVRCRKPPADVETNPPPSDSEDFVELECESCHSKQLRSILLPSVVCRQLFCLGSLKCVACGTIRVDDVDTCTGCHRTFK